MTVFTLADLEQRAAIVLVALVLDALFGEPQWLWSRVPHPVVLFGRAIGANDKSMNLRRFTGRERRMHGVGGMIGLCLAAAITGWLFSMGGPVAETILLAILLAGRSLDQHVQAVAKALDTSLAAARTSIGMIVGRRTDRLQQPEIVRAAIETAAENLSDGVIAPVLWFLIGGLPGLFVYKLVNTADSMVGYRNAHYFAYGWAAARLDDLMNYIPARLTALLIALASLGGPGGIGGAFSGIRHDARRHASPNAGWPESAMAGGLDIWLAGPRHYGNRLFPAPKLNPDGRLAAPQDIPRALGVMWRATVLFALILALVASPLLSRLYQSV